MSAADQDLKRADELFAAARFVESEDLYRQAAQARGPEYRVCARLGHLALLADRVDEARAWLGQALAREPHAALPHALLAECALRSGDAGAAASHLHATGHRGLACALEAASGPLWRRVDEGAPEPIPWVAGNPLPLIRAEVCGHAASLLVDTGCGLSGLDATFAQLAGVSAGAWDTGTFAAGRKGPVRYGVLEELALGGVRLSSAPVQVHDIAAVFAAFAPDRPVHGIVGSDVLYRFRAVLDFRGGGLTLGARGCAPASASTQALGARLWLAPGPAPLVTGRINDAPPGLLFLDTGMVGADLALPLSTAGLAGVELLRSEPRTGLGGGGPVQARTLSVDRVTLGGIVARNAAGVLLDRFPLSLQLGFRVMGLIGVELLGGWRVTLDFDAMRLQVEA